ncbi:MAG: hypothetical protein DDG60_07310 [Anaerolineae bacterium]|nr:MAG: hypothetical protein DDG60_07310 [Anaerolineae bacterium]
MERQKPEHIVPAPAIHALATLATIALVQRFIAKDEWGASLAKELVMGIVAGVPYPVAGTLVGVPLLAWSGLRQLKQWNSGNNQLVDEALRDQRMLEDKNGRE